MRRDGIDLHTRPEAGVDAVGPDLWTLADPSAGPDTPVEVTPQRVAALLHRVEL